MKTQNVKKLNEVVAPNTSEDVEGYFHSFIVHSMTPLSEEESRYIAESIQDTVNARDAENMQIKEQLEDELTDEQKQAVADAIQHLELVGPEEERCECDYNNNIMPTQEAIEDEPLLCRHLDTDDENRRLLKVVDRIPTTVPVHKMQKAAGAMLDYSYRLGYYDGVVDAFHNLERRGIDVPTLKDMNIG